MSKCTEIVLTNFFGPRGSFEFPQSTKAQHQLDLLCLSMTLLLVLLDCDISYGSTMGTHNANA